MHFIGTVSALCMKSCLIWTESVWRRFPPPASRWHCGSAVERLYSIYCRFLLLKEFSWWGSDKEAGVNVFTSHQIPDVRLCGLDLRGRSLRRSDAAAAWFPSGYSWREVAVTEMEGGRSIEQYFSTDLCGVVRRNVEMEKGLKEKRLQWFLRGKNWRDGNLTKTLEWMFGSKPIKNVWRWNVQEWWVSMPQSGLKPLKYLKNKPVSFTRT